MATIRCRGCKDMISTDKTACPHCGARVPKVWEFPAIVAAGVLVGLGAAYGGFAVLRGLTPPPPAEATAEQKQALEQERTDHDEDVRRVCLMRQTQRAPESFQIVKVVRLEGGELCVHFTIPNTMGSVVAERWTIPTGENVRPQRTTSCDGLIGKERTAAVARSLGRCPG